MSDHNTSGPILPIPDFCVVVLIGASGSGKSTFAARHFLPSEILSSDAFRTWVSDDETSLDATDDAFAALHYLARLRLKRRRLVVVDATNVQQHARKELLKLAEEYDTLAVAVVLNVAERVCQERNKERPSRQFGPHVVRNQIRNLRDTLRSIRREGFRHVYVLEDQEQIDQCRFERRPLWTDRRNEQGPFDIIGDVHGCIDELVELIGKLGYVEKEGVWTPPEGRRAIFLGDLVDRGPGVVEVVRLVMGMASAGTAMCVPGNHDIKLMRALMGRNVKIAHGIQESLDQIEALPEEEREAFKKDYIAFADGLVSHYWLDGGNLIVAHAGMKEAYQGRASRRVRDFALYGDTTGETDEFGLPVRYPWAEDYRGAATVVYGHTPVPEAEWLNRTINIDTGCVFGGKLTGLRWPEREIVQVASRKQYAVPGRPFLAEGVGPVGLGVGGPGPVGSEQLPNAGVDGRLQEAIEGVEQLRFMVEREQKMIDDLTAKMDIESKMGNAELRHAIEQERDRRRETMEKIRVSHEAAAAVVEEARKDLNRQSTSGTSEASMPRAEEDTTRGTTYVAWRKLVSDLSASVAHRLGLTVGRPEETSEDVLDAAVKRMKEAQIQNRELVVQAITQKNNLAAMTARERTTVRELEKQLSSREAGANDKETKQLRKTFATRSETLKKLELLADEATRRAEDAKLAIRKEDDAIRIAVGEALHSKTLARVDAILNTIHSAVSDAGRTPEHAPAPPIPRPTDPSAQQPSLQWQHDEVLRAEDVLGKRFVPTTLMGNVTVRAENAAAALEVMSRFAVEPRWLIYLPPTMSPSETTEEPGYLEYPREAFEYYRRNGVEQVICQAKHMGSRAVVVVCRDEEAAARRFGARNAIGVCCTRTGRQFFDNDALHTALLQEVSAAVGRAGLWDELQTDWLCLDAELMPWNAKAQGLLKEQYAPVGAAARLSLGAAVDVARQAAARGLALGEVVTRLNQRRADAERYIDAYGRYCWDTSGLQDLKLAPFHLLASEGRTYVDRDHAWHISTLNRLSGASALFKATESLAVDLSSEESVTAATNWWLEYTGAGGEGMVVKPLQFVARGPKGPVQPAVKVRGRDYLRIIYGPQYTEPENLERLRKRGLHSKRALAIREFALGVEALERFVRQEPLRLVHECVFAVLALESEPVDPRL